MSILFEERLSDSPYIESITSGHTASDGATIRPAEVHWHMVIMRYNGNVQPLVVGPWTTAGAVSWEEGAELIWIKFALGTFMPHLPTRNFLNSETSLPGAASHSFWLKGSAWQFPGYDNVETFVDRLVRADVLVRDPVVAAALEDRRQEIPSRTLRHRFLRATGLSQSLIGQFERAQRAAALLRQGVSILDSVDRAGYFDQAHLTRSLKRFIGKTPAQLTSSPEPAASEPERLRRPEPSL